MPSLLQNTVLGITKEGLTSLVDVVSKVAQVSEHMSVIVVNDMSVQNFALPWERQASGDLPFKRRCAPWVRSCLVGCTGGKGIL